MKLKSLSFLCMFEFYNLINNHASNKNKFKQKF